MTARPLSLGTVGIATRADGRVSCDAVADEAQTAAQIRDFQSVWQGGFYVGDPLDDMGSPYGLFGYYSVQHVVYLTCIRQYVTPETVALEIGPGRGAWTRTMLGAKEIWALDALSAEHNGFWEYVGAEPHVHYVQVEDFSGSMLPDDRIDYVFSFDTLCHVTFDGIEAYARNLHPKLREGAHLFWMVADLDKYRAFVDDRHRRSVAWPFVRLFGRNLYRRVLERQAREIDDRQAARYESFLALPEGPEGNWWYHAGTRRTCEMLEGVGYRVVDPDVGADPRSPIVHFVK